MTRRRAPAAPTLGLLALVAACGDAAMGNARAGRQFAEMAPQIVSRGRDRRANSLIARAA
jgi:hypothetical protein